MTLAETPRRRVATRPQRPSDSARDRNQLSQSPKHRAISAAGSCETLPDRVWRQQLRRRLLRWFERQRRDLPWRRTRDPYAIWVSEIMLQQTQVAAVVPYYERFLTRFPTVRELAATDEDQVLRVWEGLGYYRRARQLHDAARRVVQQFGGRFPREFAAARSLPGIGRYTAGAILSIAFDARHPVLEGNTVRLYSRLLAYRDDPHSAAGQRRLWDFATEILPRRQVGALNQALMELGSTICRPRAPACDACPLAVLCPTQAHGWQQEIPRAKRRPDYAQVHETAVVVRRRGKVLLRRCGPDERWAGLWDFPRFSLPAPTAAQVDSSHVVQQVQRLTGITVELGSPLTVLRHGVTRFQITLSCYEASYRAGRLQAACGCAWVGPQDLDRYPLSVTGRKISRLLR